MKLCLTMCVLFFGQTLLFAEGSKSAISADDWIVVASTADQGPQVWTYRTHGINPLPEDWFEVGFEFENRGLGGFGSYGTPGAVIGTEWLSKEIVMRRDFFVPRFSSSIQDARLWVHHDEDCEVYINGTHASSLTGYTVAYGFREVSPESIATIQQGVYNSLAVHCRNTEGGQYIDVGVVVR